MIYEQVVVGPLQVNCSIIACEKTLEAAVIDPGDEMRKILAKVKQKNLNLKYILVTHGHADHIAHLMRLKNETNVDILMHADDKFLFGDIALHAAMFGLPDPGNPVVDQFLSDDEIIELGELKIKVMHTPGHSPGSITFQVENHLFVGDLIFYRSIGRTDLPGGDYDTLINSVKTKIFTYPEETIIHPGHGPDTTVGQEMKFNPYFN